MTYLEIALADIGELTKKHKPQRLKENRRVAKAGGEVAKNTREDIEKRLKETIVTKDNRLDYQYVDYEQLEEKV